MIAYNSTLLDNTLLVDEALNLKKSDFIDSVQYKTMVNELPTLKGQKNLLIRFGFFLLGSFLYSSICGMLSMFSINYVNFNYEVLLFVYSGIGFAGIELLARQKHYGFGLDDGFLLGAQMLLFVGVGISTNGNFLAIFVTIATVSSISYLRYIYLSSALLICIGFTGSLAYLMFEFGIIGKSILPFVMMFFSTICYLFSKKVLKNLKLPYYAKGIELVNSFSLILFYLSGNYMVVRELSILLLGKNIQATQEIPFAILFYAFTISIPSCYLFYSLIKKDKPMLWVGFLALAFSLFTIRFYHHIFPAELALTFGGLVLFAFTYFSIKKLKDKDTGITFKSNRFSNYSLLNAETLIIASQFGLKSEIKPEESPMKFNGGGFSGGGSGGEY